MLKHKLKLLLFACVWALLTLACQNRGGNPDVPPVSKEDAVQFTSIIQGQADKMKDLAASYANLQNEMKALQDALQQATPAQKKKIVEWDALMQKVEAVAGRAALGATEIVSLSGTLALTAQQLRDTFQILPLVQGAYKNVYEPRCNEYLMAYERLPIMAEELRKTVVSAGIEVAKVSENATPQQVEVKK